MNTRRIQYVFQKEVTDNLRDRRSIFSALLSPLIGPVLILVMIILVGKSLFSNPQEETIKLPVAGAENAPNLINFLSENGVEVVPAPQDPALSIRNSDYDIILIVTPEFGEKLAQGLPAPVQLVFDSSRQSAYRTMNRVQSLIGAYRQQTAVLRLMARGINPLILNAISIEEHDVATPQSQSLIFLNMMPYFIILTVFMGGMYVIIDATAGERERGSLEPLLINPVRRSEFVIGKTLASIPFAIFSLLLTLAVFALGFNLIPLEDFLGFQMTLDIKILVDIFGISLPIVFLAAAVQMIVASFTRSFKEAQSYLPLLSLVPALPGIFLAFLPVKPQMWAMLIPTLGQQFLINQMMRGETPDPLHVAVTVVMTLLVSVICLIVAVRLYEREQIIFSK